jgi:hypothetical protein
LAQWYVPQSVRWDPAEVAESTKKARDAGWLIEEFKTLCPQHDEEERQKRRNAYYDKLCACGHALGNHSPITGECMLCDHGHGATS